SLSSSFLSLSPRGTPVGAPQSIKPPTPAGLKGQPSPWSREGSPVQRQWSSGEGEACLCPRRPRDLKIDRMTDVTVLSYVQALEVGPALKPAAPEQSDPAAHAIRTARRRLLAVVALLVVCAVAATLGGLARQGGIDRTRHRLDAATAGARRLEAGLVASRDDTARLTKRLRRSADMASVFDVDPATITGEGLDAVGDLPGRSTRLDATTRSQGQASDVIVAERLKRSEGLWQPWCNATVARIGDKVVVVSAAHCFDDDRTRLIDRAGRTGATVADATRSSTKEFAIMVTSAAGATPLARVHSLSLSLVRSADFAVLVPEPADLDRLVSAAAPATYTAATPTPGEDVGVFAAPQGNGYTPLSTTGVYLGAGDLFQEEDGASHHLLFVAIPDESGESNPCSYGSSGSSSRFADGFVTGPLSFWDNAHDSKRSSWETEHDRYSIEHLLGVDLSDYPTICAYSAPDLSMLQSLASLSV